MGVALNELALFAGCGGGLLASRLLGFDTVAAVEIEHYARAVLLARQRDGHLDDFPIWDDVATFDGRPWRGLIDVVTGGFPCQDISAADKGRGITGKRSGLWSEYLRIVTECRPRLVFAENSPMLRTRGLGTVIQGLTALGYNVRWCVLGAWHVGAPHKRDRMWVLAELANADVPGRQQSDKTLARKQAKQPDGPSFYADSMADADGKRELQPGGRVVEIRRRISDGGKTLADADEAGLQGRISHGVPNEKRRQVESNGRAPKRGTKWEGGRDSFWWAAEPELGRVAHGVADRVDRIKGLGNGQVPDVAALAFRVLTQANTLAGLIK